MKAIVMQAIGSAEHLKLEERALPIPKQGEIRIRIQAVGFNPVDWKMRQGHYGATAGQILGCDCSGVVDALGAGVTEFSIGDAVYAMPFLRSSNGSYAEFVSVPVELACKKPSNLTFVKAACIPLAAMTAYRATLACLPCNQQKSVFIAGVGGGVGSFVLQLIKNSGAQEIYTMAKNIKSAQFLQEHLSIEQEHILLYEGLSTEQQKQRLLTMHSNRLFDTTVDLVGGKTKQLCLELTGYSGHFSTILPEKEFLFPIWAENAIPRIRNLSIHQVAVMAELQDSNREYWEIYSRHLKHISQMLEEEILHPPFVEVIGPLEVNTVQKAHSLLEQGLVKGKLVMVVE